MAGCVHFRSVQRFVALETSEGIERMERVVGVLRPDIVEKRRADESASWLRFYFNRTSTKLQIVLLDGMAGYEIVELSC